MQLLESCQDNPPDVAYLLRVRCKTDTALFAAYFFPEYCEVEFGPHHQDILEDMRDFRRGVKRSYAAPRGSAKSTLITLVKVIHRIVYELEKFIVVISETESQATDMVMSIRAELEGNDALREVYGNLVNKKHWLKQDIITANDIRISAFASRSAIRGKKHRNHRPTWIVLDDVENRKSVKSPEQRADLADWLKKDVMKAGVAGHTNFDMVGTMLHPDSLLANTHKNPGWKSRLYKSVYDWPSTTAQGYWNKWKEIITDLTNPERDNDADKYYQTYKDVMLEGVKVLWPAWEPFVELMKALTFEGRASFNTEKQNNPVNPDTALFDMEESLTVRVDHDADLIRRSDGRMARLSTCRFFGYLDPAFGDTVEGDYACIVVVAVDGWGYVYVVDVWIKKAPPSAQIEAAFDLGAKWNLTALGLEINNGWKLMVKDFDLAAQERRKRGEYSKLRVQKITNSENKDDRIATLEPKVANHWIGFAENLNHAYREQMEQYPTAHYDDGPDATEGAIQTAKMFVTLFGGAPVGQAA